MCIFQQLQLLMSWYINYITNTLSLFVSSIVLNSGAILCKWMKNMYEEMWFSYGTMVSYLLLIELSVVS